MSGRFVLLRLAFAQAEPEELVRGFLALALVGVLIALVFIKPVGNNATAATASAKTLSIAVVAFYFGLHKGTPAAGKATPKAVDGATQDSPAANAPPSPDA